jgi:hypothetical protein
MQISPLQRGIYNHQADRIERAFSSLEFPARIQGGEIGCGHVRFHLASFPDIPTREVREIASKVAEVMGVYNVHMDEAEDGWVLDLSFQGESSLRLLPLIQGLNNLLPLTTVLGIAVNGKPLLLNLHRDEMWHLFVHGPNSTGKSELLRTFILSLALKNRPSQVQFLGIDLSGKELMVIDALPHALSEVAVDGGYAGEMIHWLAQEIDRRQKAQINSPDVILVIDELERVMEHSEMLLKRLPLILHKGPKTGIHLAATSREIRPGAIIPRWRKTGVVIAKASKRIVRKKSEVYQIGMFDFYICGERIIAQVAWLPANDLQRAVRSVCKRRASNNEGVSLKALRK